MLADLGGLGKLSFDMIVGHDIQRGGVLKKFNCLYLFELNFENKGYTFFKKDNKLVNEYRETDILF